MIADTKKLLLVAPFAPETRVQYFDSRDLHESEHDLNDEELESKFPSLVHILKRFLLQCELTGWVGSSRRW